MTDERDAYEQRMNGYGAIRSVPPPANVRITQQPPTLWRRIRGAFRGAWLGFWIGWNGGIP